jgi:hypothetical protein
MSSKQIIPQIAEVAIRSLLTMAIFYSATAIGIIGMLDQLREVDCVVA